MAKRSKLDEYFAFVDLCFFSIDDDSDQGVAEKTGLSVSTVRRFRRHEFTLSSHIGTLDALSSAAGLKLITDGKKIRMKVA